MIDRAGAHLRRNVIAYLALFVALGGTSYAAVSNITSAQIKNNTIQGKDIKNGTLTSADVGNGSLLAQDFKAGQLPSGARGPQGLAGAQGGQGVQGDQGVPGRDGAAVTVRARSTGSVHTPTDGSTISVPLTSNTWTQAPSELDIGPYGSITYTAPPTGSCPGGNGVADLNIEIDVDGKSVLNQATAAIPGEATKTGGIAPPATLFEPGSAQAHTVTAKVAGFCHSVASPADFTVSDLRLDFVRAL